MDELDITYALAKQVPDLERGFAISTSYGDISIPPGPLASGLRAHLERALQQELRGLQQGTHLTELEQQLGFGG
jgi:hypothetical protein